MLLYAKQQATTAITLLALGVWTSVAVADEIVVRQKNKSFSTEKVTIKSGDSIKFVNDDDTSHNVFSRSESQAFNLGVQKIGVSSSQIFTKPGEVEVRCAIHPKMKLKVTIK